MSEVEEGFTAKSKRGDSKLTINANKQKSQEEIN